MQHKKNAYYSQSENFYFVCTSERSDNHTYRRYAQNVSIKRHQITRKQTNLNKQTSHTNPNTSKLKNPNQVISQLNATKHKILFKNIYELSNEMV